MTHGSAKVGPFARIGNIPCYINILRLLLGRSSREVRSIFTRSRGLDQALRSFLDNTVILVLALNLIVGKLGRGPRDLSRRVAVDFLGGPTINLPTEVPIAVADSSGRLGGDGRDPILVSHDAPTQVAPPSTVCLDGRLEVDQLGNTSLAPLIVLGAVVTSLATTPVRDRLR